MIKLCIDCNSEFECKTSAKRCKTCQDKFKKENNRRKALKCAYNSGRIRNPHAGSGGMNKGQSIYRYFSDIPDSYKSYRKDYCELCNSTNNLIVHHIDWNRNHNEQFNLITICRSCHARIHKAAVHLNEAK